MGVTISLDLSQAEDGLLRLSKFTAVAEEGLRQAVKETAERIREDFIRAIEGGSKSGRVYIRRGKRHRASAPGQAPASDSGMLVRRTRVSVSKRSISAGVVAGPSDFYARFLESGTKRIMLRPALVQARDKHVQDFIDQVMSALDAAAVEVSSP
jgi:hypothetical protein